jgi:hypothetical protein
MDFLQSLNEEIDELIEKHDLLWKYTTGHNILSRPKYLDNIDIGGYADLDISTLSISDPDIINKLKAQKRIGILYRRIRYAETYGVDKTLQDILTGKI